MYNAYCEIRRNYSKGKGGEGKKGRERRKSENNDNTIKIYE